MPESDDDAEKARIQRQLIQALEKAHIPERDDTNWLPKLFGGAVSYWQMRAGNVEIVIRSRQFTGGSIECSLHLESLVRDRDQDALVDSLIYLRVVISDILPSLSDHLLARSFNVLPLSIRRSLKDQAGVDFSAARESILKSRHTEIVSRLRAERDSRGGSDPRLTGEDSRTLHLQHEEATQMAKQIKKDYEHTFRTFDENHSRNGYKWEQWQEFWVKYSAELYPRHNPDFLALFASQENPTSREVAYRWLASYLPHEVSYIKKLVTKSRRGSQTIKSSD